MSSDPDAAGWYRWEEVEDKVVPLHRLVRASSPNYDKKFIGDAGMDMTEEAVDFLADRGIDQVLSLNSVVDHDDEIKAKLESRKIKYTHAPVRDWTAPTLDQLKDGFRSYTLHRATVVYCGYGYGRTGTMVSAIQILAGHKLSHQDYKDNHVEERNKQGEQTGQFQVLDDLQNEVFGLGE